MSEPTPLSAVDLTRDERISLLSGQSVWRSQALPERGVPGVLMTDGPHGLRLQTASEDHLGLGESRPATCFPPAVTVASSWNPALAEEIAAAISREAQHFDIGLVLGPGLNIKRHPLCGRNFEYFSEDPMLAGRFAAAMVKGLQDGGTGACVKHYAVNNQESHRFVVDAVLDERTLRELYLAGFEHAVKTAKPWAVMASYNLVSGEGVTVSKRLLTDVLCDEWGFDGVVVSDWGATRSRADGVTAGMDLDMPGAQGLSDGEVARALDAGTLEQRDVTRSAQRVLALAARACTDVGTQAPLPDDVVESHHQLARRAASEGTVLLRNDGTLPLERTARLAVIGAFAEHPRYQGAGSSRVNPTRLTTVLEAAEQAGLDVTYVAAYDPEHPDDDVDVSDAVAAARDADVALVLVGLPEAYESEGFDRAHLGLPRGHDALVEAVAAANPWTVVVLSNGAPVTMPWLDEVAAVLETYLGGQAGAEALIDVVTGAREPGGRLAETFPHAREDVASDPWFPGEPRQVTYREALAVGYRHTTSGGPAPLFPFGFGLGYATLAWGDATLSAETIAAGDAVTVDLDVRNTSERDGRDVVQVYLRDETGAVTSPAKKLVAFAPVEVAAGDTVRVTLSIEPRAFAFYAVESAGWRTPSGRFVVEVARNSHDVVDEHVVMMRSDVRGQAAARVPEPLVAASDEAFARRLGHPIPEARSGTPVHPRVDDRGDRLDGCRARAAGSRRTRHHRPWRWRSERATHGGAQHR